MKGETCYLQAELTPGDGDWMTIAGITDFFARQNEFVLHVVMQGITRQAADAFDGKLNARIVGPDGFERLITIERFKYARPMWDDRGVVYGTALVSARPRK